LIKCVKVYHTQAWVLATPTDALLKELFMLRGIMSIAYYYYEAAHAVAGPLRAVSGATKFLFNSPANPLTYTAMGRNIAAACEMFERTTRRYGKPEFDLPSTNVNGIEVPIHERIVWEKPFCRVVHFDREFKGKRPEQPKMLIVAPMSGHYATLLRGTVQSFLSTHEVYITDWADARMVPLVAGEFNLDTYIDYVIEILQHMGPHVHVVAVCQPSVPVMAAAAVMDAHKDTCAPASMILMGGPIDTRRSPTKVNLLAKERGMEWFKSNCIVKVPFNSPGFLREVYPGFLQLSGFMAMNAERHMMAHWEMYQHLVKDDGDSAEKHRDFYDEYLSVMDLTAEFYLQTVDAVFVSHSLPKGEMTHRGEIVDLNAIHTVALMTVEGEKDDISGIGQTQAAHDLTPNLPDRLKLDHLQKGVGHYGVFNGSKFRNEIAPRMTEFIAMADQESKSTTKNVVAITSAKKTTVSRKRGV
jgi:poly(3-hydroxybutyrate) depolymerase